MTKTNDEIYQNSTPSLHNDCHAHMCIYEREKKRGEREREDRGVGLRQEFYVFGGGKSSLIYFVGYGWLVFFIG